MKKLVLTCTWLICMVVGYSQTQSVDKLISIGSVYQKQNNYPSALDHYLKALSICQETGDKKNTSYLLNLIGIVYNEQGKMPQALEYFSKSLKIAEAIGYKKEMAAALSNMGEVYYRQGNSKVASEYYIKSLKIFKEIDDKQNGAAVANSIGVIFLSEKDIPQALKLFQFSLELKKQAGDRNIATVLNNIGLAYTEQGDTSKALKYFNKSANTGYPKDVIDARRCLGEMYLRYQNYPQAVIYSKLSIDLAQEIGYIDGILANANVLYNAHKLQGNTKEALTYHELYIQMRDSIVNQESRKKILRIQMQSQFDVKEAELKAEQEKREIQLKARQEQKEALLVMEQKGREAILKMQQHEREAELKAQQEKKLSLIRAEQEKKEALTQAEKKKQRIVLFLVSGFLMLVAALAGLIFKNLRKTQKQKNIIEIKEKETQEQNHLISEQKKLIEERHKEITDSINYAERIQRSFMATKEILNSNLSEYFILFKPKDVVSGDFYWSGNLANNNFALVTADSTGHGVPGAIMSLLNITSLEKAVEQNIIQPEKILGYTRTQIINRLKKDGSAEGGKDGMDCSLCVYDFASMKLYVAAANNPVWVVRKSSEEVLEIKPDKMPVGKHDRQDIPFTQHEIELKKGDVVYTLTDGFPDQFGGPNGKKFMIKNLREKIVAIAHLPMQEQKQILDNVLTHWVGALEQVDDITVIGVRI